HAGTGCAHRVHAETGRLRHPGRICGPSALAGVADERRAAAAPVGPRGESVAPGSKRAAGRPVMAQRAQIRMLDDQRRLHLQDGPIDLIVEAFGDLREVRCAYQAAACRFADVLDELCAELPLLRTRVVAGVPWLSGRIARRMAAAVAPYASRTFITPMAAVA